MPPKTMAVFDTKIHRIRSCFSISRVLQLLQCYHFHRWNIASTATTILADTAPGRIRWCGLKFSKHTMSLKQQEAHNYLQRIWILWMEPGKPPMKLVSGHQFSQACTIFRYMLALAFFRLKLVTSSLSCGIIRLLLDTEEASQSSKMNPDDKTHNPHVGNKHNPNISNTIDHDTNEPWMCKCVKETTMIFHQKYTIQIHLPGTRNNHFKMDVWWNSHFLCKELESSNWNNH